VAAFLLVGACKQEASKPPQEPRLVRAIVVTPNALSAANDTVGDIEPRRTGNLGFQVGGRLIERLVDTGATVHKGEVLARLDSADQKNRILSADAQVRAAQASVDQAVPLEARYREMLTGGVTTPQRYEEAKKQLQRSTGELADAKAQLAFAQDQLAYTQLTAANDGIVLSTGADLGQVVSAGQMVVQVADRRAREAVRRFRRGDRLCVCRHADQGAAEERPVDLHPWAGARGRPQRRPGDGSTPFESLPTPPDAMRLGAIVVGRPEVESQQVIRIPSGALLQTGATPAVWVVEGTGHEVRKRPVKVLRFDTDTVLIAEGLGKGDIVITAGVNSLADGQKVHLAAELGK
jgi:multidrug efflux pump subunit AcrA (membrane-fusion protein)